MDFLKKIALLGVAAISLSAVSGCMAEGGGDDDEGPGIQREGDDD